MTKRKPTRQLILWLALMLAAMLAGLVLARHMAGYGLLRTAPPWDPDPARRLPLGRDVLAGAGTGAPAPTAYFPSAYFPPAHDPDLPERKNGVRRLQPYAPARKRDREALMTPYAPYMPPIEADEAKWQEDWPPPFSALAGAPPHDETKDTVPDDAADRTAPATPGSASWQDDIRATRNRILDQALSVENAAENAKQNR